MKPGLYPAYLNACKNGKLDKLIEKTFKLLKSCSLCPRRCGINRIKDEKGFCKTGLKPKVCSFLAHQGEEPPISGQNGSGTIFFSGCNMACAYCQNYGFSQLGEGREVNFKELAGYMLKLQEMGCHNINLVSPTQVMPQILKSLKIAAGNGLKLPLVYNTGGYELAGIIKLLDGIVDIYLPDMRYAEPRLAKKYSSAPDYPKYNREAVKEMHCQAGLARIDKNGILTRGLIVRHLVLPNNISGTDKIMAFIAKNLSKETYISLMSQYSPYHKAGKFTEIGRRITYQEYEKAREIMQKYGLHNGWTQESGGLERFAGIHIKPSI